jgi:hypothetical protein
MKIIMSVLKNLLRQVCPMHTLPGIPISNLLGFAVVHGEAMLSIHSGKTPYYVHHVHRCIPHICEIPIQNARNRREKVGER